VILSNIAMDEERRVNFSELNKLGVVSTAKPGAAPKKKAT
jgi:hypothetical protein